MTKRRIFYKSLFKRRGFYKRGFTLLELILAVALIVFGVVAVVSVMSSGISTDSSVEGQIKALNLAQEKMDTLKNTSFASVLSNSAEAASIGGAFSEYGREVVVEAMDGLDVSVSKLKKVTVFVTWTYHGAAQSLNLVTLLTDTWG